MLIFIIFIVLMVCFPLIRCFIGNIYLVLYNAFVDTYKYIRYKRWNECKNYGTIDVFASYSDKVFGCGKTLNGVKYVQSVYERYNGKKVYNFKQKKWEIQTIKIVSNVDLKIPYTKLVSTDDIINCHKDLNESSVCIVFIDEASTEFNSRNFKTNISSTLLNSMLTCRHHKFGMILTAQRFNHIDALIRQITCRVALCRKIWRFQMLYTCSAWDLENASNIDMVKHSKSCWFVQNKHYNAYDTSAIVDEIKRRQANGDLLSDSEVLALQGEQTVSDIKKVYKPSRKMKKYSGI